MTKYRNRVEIIADVLNVASGGAKKTKIMYVANLSYKLLEKYLAETIKIGFVRFTNDRYEVTEKGRAFLERFNDVSSKYSMIEKTLQVIAVEREALGRMCEASGDDCRRRVHRKRCQEFAILSAKGGVK